MDKPQESRAHAIARLRMLWGRDPGLYWSELRKAKLTTNEVFPEYAVTDPIVLPDLDKGEQIKKGKK